MKGKLFLAVLVAFLTVGFSAAQTGTQHGVGITWPVGTVVSGSTDTIAGYNIYRCTGTCSNTSISGWSKLDGTLDANLTYLDQSALVTGTVYNYVVTSVDPAGNESAFSPMATVTFSAIVNPNPPASCNAKVQ